MDKKIAFIKYGSFSHTNASVSAMLRQHFADYELEVIDVPELLGRSQAASIFNVLSILKYYGGDILKRRRSFRQCNFRTPYMFARIKERMQKRLGRNLSSYVFSLPL
jgi:hypothetical protein